MYTVNNYVSYVSDTLTYALACHDDLFAKLRYCTHLSECVCYTATGTLAAE